MVLMEGLEVMGMMEGMKKRGEGGLNSDEEARGQ